MPKLPGFGESRQGYAQMRHQREDIEQDSAEAKETFDHVEGVQVEDDSSEE